MVYTPSTLTRFVAIRPAQGNAGAFNQKDITVAASQTINRYDIVSLSSGKVQQSIADPGAASTSNSGGNLPIYGIALAAITTDSAGNSTDGQLRTSIPVAIFDGNLEIAVRIYNATASNTQAADLTLGTSYQFTRWDTVNYTNAAGNTVASVGTGYALITTTTNGELRYVESWGSNSGSDNYELVWVRPTLSDTVRQG